MIVLSLALVVASLALLIAGLAGASSGLIWASIAASLVAALCLTAVTLRRRNALQRERQVYDDEVAAAERQAERDRARPAERGRDAEREQERAARPVRDIAEDVPDIRRAARPAADEAPTEIVPAVTADTEPPAPPAPLTAAPEPEPATAAEEPEGADPEKTESVSLESIARGLRDASAHGKPVSEEALPAAEAAEDDEDDYPDPPDEPAEEDVLAPDALRVVDLDVDVFVVDGRPRYHLADCPHLAGREVVPLPVPEAREAGFTPCSLCKPDSTLAERARTDSRAKRASASAGAGKGGPDKPAT